ncbi:MAG: rhodanese-like domain-containing protein [Eudoraea sp.]|nr:rhodanese-like domain-containing protein [Eudoraea sp.]MBT8210742.1 rhodanese-like domain-containing protein [Eudoraea sp.]NNK30774.1 rhodanese-like domain-containing protein [Flavobacteriaceae bacterium]
MKKFLYLLVFVSLLFSCTEAAEKPITELTSEDIENAVLIDVRTPEEFAEGHLEGAINYNWYDEGFAQQFEAIGKNKKIYVYCKVGGRSASAAKFLDSLGYSRIIDLTGGYDAWLEAQD